MSSIIAIACHDTVDNGRTKYTVETLSSLYGQVDWSKHRLIVIDNGSCEETKDFLKEYESDWFGENEPLIITLPENIGTARAINKAIEHRRKDDYFIKMDNDCVVHQSGWVGELEEAMRREPKLGILGLKRRDLRQTPYDPDINFRSEIIQLQHEVGQRWIHIEKTNDIMGTCTMLSPALLDTIGYYFQGYGNCYGFDDNLISLRSLLAGFYNAFLCGIDISHIDVGDNPYVQVKQKQAAKYWGEYQQLHIDYCEGKRPIYEEFN